MTENTNTNNQLTDYHRQKNKEEMKRNVISFAMMIVSTIIAFAVVASGVMDRVFAIFLLFILAVAQVAFQFFYFMHMKEKGHAMPAVMIVAGTWAAFLTTFGLIAAVWW